MSDLAKFDEWLRRTLAPFGVELRGPSDDYLRDVKYWVIGKAPKHHLIEVSGEAVEDGTDLILAAVHLQKFAWPGSVAGHAGKAYLFKSDGSVVERQV